MAFLSRAQVIEGHLHFRANDFPSSTDLNGTWEFYWNELLDPGAIDGPPDFIQFPALWNGQVVGGDTLTPIGYATYRMTIHLEGQKRDYALFIDDMYCAYRLFINGQVARTNGRVGTSRETYEPQWQPGVVRLPRLSGDVELVLQVANFHHSKGGVADPVKFGPVDEITSTFEQFIRLDVILAGVFVGLALLFLIRFGFISLDIASFYFSLFCLVYSYRIVGTDLYALHHFVADYSWHLGIVLEYITLFISPFLFAKYVQSMYPADISKWAVNALGLIGVLFAIMTLVMPAFWFTTLVEPFFVILVGYFFYVFMIFSTVFLGRRPGAQWGLVSIAIVCGVFIYLMLVYIGYLPSQPYTVYIGYFLFLLFQTLQLWTYSRHFIRRTDLLQEV